MQIENILLSDMLAPSSTLHGITEINKQQTKASFTIHGPFFL